MKFSGKCNIKQTSVALNDPSDQFKTPRSIKVELTIDMEIVNELLGNDAELFWQDTGSRDARWFALKKVVLDIVLTRHECCLFDLDLGDVTIKGFEFLPVGMGLAELTCTIYPSTPPAMATADKLQQAVNRTSVNLSIRHTPEPVTDDISRSDQPSAAAIH